MTGFVAGCDLGSTAGKALIMRDNQIIAYAVINAAAKPEETARKVMDEALRNAGLESLGEIGAVVCTGYGRSKFPYEHENISEITCHARGAYWLSPKVRTLIDIGGQDCKVIAMDDGGKVRDFGLNDKCAAGTGRFFEVMARVLEIDLKELSSLARQSTNPVSITSQCSVFVESEVVSLMNDGVNLADIAAGLHASIAGRLTSQVKSLGPVEEDISVSGGCAKNRSLIEYLQKKLGKTIQILPEDPQIVGALGAALIAATRPDKSALRR